MLIQAPEKADFAPGEPRELRAPAMPMEGPSLAARIVGVPTSSNEDNIMEVKADAKSADPDTTNKLGEPDPNPGAVDRPGFDLGGSTGRTSAGTGLGLGEDAAKSRRNRRLPGRRGEPR